MRKNGGNCIVYQQEKFHLGRLKLTDVGIVNIVNIVDLVGADLCVCPDIEFVRDGASLVPHWVYKN